MKKSLFIFVMPFMLMACQSEESKQMEEIDNKIEAAKQEEQEKKEHLDRVEDVMKKGYSFEEADSIVKALEEKNGLK